MDGSKITIDLDDSLVDGLIKWNKWLINIIWLVYQWLITGCSLSKSWLLHIGGWISLQSIAVVFGRAPNHKLIPLESFMTAMPPVFLSSTSDVTNVFPTRWGGLVVARVEMPFDVWGPWIRSCV